MDHEKMLAALNEHIRLREERWATMTPEAVQQEAREYLVKLGTHFPNGRLTPRYGGDPANEFMEPLA